MLVPTTTKNISRTSSPRDLFPSSAYFINVCRVFGLFLSPPLPDAGRLWRGQQHGRRRVPARVSQSDPALLHSGAPLGLGPLQPPDIVSRRATEGDAAVVCAGDAHARLPHRRSLRRRRPGQHRNPETLPRGHRLGSSGRGAIPRRIRTHTWSPPLSHPCHLKDSGRTARLVDEADERKPRGTSEVQGCTRKLCELTCIVGCKYGFPNSRHKLSSFLTDLTAKKYVKIVCVALEG